MLILNKITYAINGRRLFDEASANISTGHKVGFFGPNGAGKTTLFRILRGEIPLESGRTEISRKARIGGVAQEAPSSNVSLRDTVVAADTERAALLSEETDDPMRIAEIQTRLVDIDAWSAEGRAATILNGLGFDDEAQQRPCSDFSGGWRMRVALAAILFAQPDILLLDEPTNYLDLEGALWLENYLAKYPHTVIIISHDRGLLNRAVNSILHLEDKKLTLYQGNYEQFAKARNAQRAVQAASAKKQAAQREHLQSFVNRFKAKASKAKQAQSRVKALEKMEIITPPSEAAKHVFTFPQPDELSPPILSLENAGAGYDGKAVLSDLNLRIDQDDRIALLGKNGEGKSTLSKLIAGKLPPLGGRMVQSSKLRIGYFAQHQVDELHLNETPLQHLQSALPNQMPSRLRAKLSGFGLGVDQAETAVGKLSGGQKARLSLLLATLDAPHLLILDEPTNHLDIESREALTQALTQYSGAVILVSHDMHLLSLAADRLWLVNDGKVKVYDEDLDEYRRFLLGKPKAKPKQKPKEKKATEKPKPAAQPVIRTAKDAKRELQRCEDRVDKLNAMREKLQTKLADPDLYEAHNAKDLRVWQSKFAEVEADLNKAENLWMQAIEHYDKLKDS